MKTGNDRSPLDRSPPLRVAGQSLDEEIERLLDEHAVGPYMLVVLMVIVAGLEWWRWANDLKPNPWLFTGVAVLAVLFAIFKIVRTHKQAKQLKLGRDGERAVAEHLEWLRAHNFVVMHDIPNGDANVDHVLIGPKGIHTIETKTISKPRRGPCKVTVEDGVIRVNGRELDRDPVVQAKAQAGWLKNFFAESQFKAVVQPVVVIPGWFVEPFDMKKAGAWVLEIKALKAFIINQPERYPLEEVKAMASALRSHIRSLPKR